METLNTITRFWVLLKLHPPLETAEPPNWAETPGGCRESPETPRHAAAGPSHVGDAVVDVTVGIAVDNAAGSVSRTCKTSPAKATGNRLRSAKLIDYQQT